MFTRTSRYKQSAKFSADSTASSSVQEETEGTFAGVQPRPIRTHDGAIEHLVKQEDRLDLLARYYYNDCLLYTSDAADD